MLLRKLFRTMGRYKAQFISMIIMIALGVGVFFGFNMEWYTLEKNTGAAYSATGYSDYRLVSEKGFSQEDLDAILAGEGVTDAARFLSVNASVKGDSDVLALTANTNMSVSGVMLIDGAPYDAESADGMWLSDRYAEKNGVKVGDRLTLVYKNIELEGVVRGLVKASEYIICLPDAAQVMPDYNTYGFVYITPAALKNALGAEFYTQINVISPLDKAEFTALSESALGRTVQVLGREDVVTWSEVQGEINEGVTMGSILPVLFLAIAVLTMVTTMHRVAASEKTQIGTLKALGFKDRRIVLHYASFALVIGLFGTAFGIGVGYLLAWYIMNPDGAMATYIDMPDWTLRIPPVCWAVLVGINAFLLLIGFASVKSMLKGTAADALRPYVPKQTKHLLIERTRFFKRLGFGARWNLRDSLRHKSRTFMTLFGIVGCMVLLVGALGMNDTIDSFVDSFYEQAINYETRINLDAENTSKEQAYAIAERYSGDVAAQTGVRLGDETVMLEVYDITHDKVRFNDGDMKLIALSDSGAYVCARIADEYGVAEGGSLTFSLYGGNESFTVPVAGVVRTMSKSVVMTAACADRLGVGYSISAVFTDETEIAPDEHIIGTQSKRSIMDSFDTFMELMVTMVALLVLAAVVLGVVVLYNLGVMSYTERYREMATLKVVGFKDKQIGRLLIGQNVWLTVVGVLIGLPAGAGVLQYLLTALASEYEMKLVIGVPTVLVSTALTFGVSLIVGLMISRKNKRIDMVAALKTEE